MKAMILAFESPGDFAKRRADKSAYDAYMAPWMAYSDAMAKAGIMRGGAALKEPETATVVSLENGKRRVEDGPFTDTKEQLGGYFVIEVSSMDEAVRWGAQCPAAKTGFVDVRPLADYGQGE